MTSMTSSFFLQYITRIHRSVDIESTPEPFLLPQNSLMSSHSSSYDLRNCQSNVSFRAELVHFMESPFQSFHSNRRESVHTCSDGLLNFLIYYAS